MSAILTDSALEEALATLADWQVERERTVITRHFTFSTFREAFGFMTEVALLAERCDHHPEWYNFYRMVTITLISQDVGGITKRDITMAKTIDKISARFLSE